jgi:hypothetical protein
MPDQKRVGNVEGNKEIDGWQRRTAAKVLSFFSRLLLVCVIAGYEPRLNSTLREIFSRLKCIIETFVRSIYDCKVYTCARWRSYDDLMRCYGKLKCNNRAFFLIMAHLYSYIKLHFHII